MVLGRCSVVTGQDKDDALATITEHLLPGRWDTIRHPPRREDAATTVLVDLGRVVGQGRGRLR